VINIVYEDLLFLLSNRIFWGIKYRKTTIKKIAIEMYVEIKPVKIDRK